MSLYYSLNPSLDPFLIEAYVIQTKIAIYIEITILYRLFSYLKSIHGIFDLQ
jgi:hypothetical protein